MKTKQFKPSDTGVRACPLFSSFVFSAVQTFPSKYVTVERTVTWMGLLSRGARQRSSSFLERHKGLFFEFVSPDLGWGILLPRLGFHIFEGSSNRVSASNTLQTKDERVRNGKKRSFYFKLVYVIRH